MRILGIVLTCLLTSICCTSQKNGPRNSDIAERMAKATKDHQYDEAVRIGLGTLKGNPADGLVLSQIGLVYMKRAEDDPQQQQRWLDLATQYADKTLAATPKDELNHFTAARLYESAGDLSREKRCSYYSVAVELFERLGMGLGQPAKDNQTPGASSEKIRVTAKQSALEITKRASAANCPMPSR